MASVLAQPYRFTIALWLLLLIGLVIVLGASQESDECYTELFLANNETRLCSNAQASEDVWCIDIQVGIVNRESEPTEYILAFQTPAGASVLDPFTLEDGEMGEANIELPASTCEQEADVDIVLYRTSTPSPYRSIRLSCDFLSYHADD